MSQWPEAAKVLASGQSEAAQLLTGELAQQAEGGPNVEPETAAMFRSVIRGGTYIQAFLEEAAEQTIIRRRIKSGAAVSFLRTVLIDYFHNRYAEAGEQFSDLGRLDEQAWERPFSLLNDDLTSDRSMAMSSARASLYFRVAATPVKERKAPQALVGQFIKDRYPDGIRALEVGSSLGVGALQLLYKDQFALEFEKVTIARADQDTELEITDKANEVVSRPLHFKQIVCVDKFPFYYEDRMQYDIANARFALNGLRPSERNNQAYMDTVRALLDKKQVGSGSYDPECQAVFHRADMLNPQELGDFSHRFPGTFDMIAADYVTQELPAEDQLKLHHTLLSLLADNGVLLYNHQARLEPPNVPRPASIDHVEHFSTYATIPFRGNMHIVDNLHPVQGIQEPLSYYDNRCRWTRLRAGGGCLVVKGSLQSLSDLVLNS